MTIEEIKACTKDMLTPADIADVIGSDKYTINQQVKDDKKAQINSFCFPTIVVKTRVKIPRVAFLKALKEWNE